MEASVTGIGFTMILVTLVNLIAWGLRIVIVVLLIMALVKYLTEKKGDKQDVAIKKSLGEVLKDRRIQAQLTQEFVAESLGVTRQAVSKWENGTADPSTTNLLKLAKLYNISPEELLRSVATPES